MLLARAAILIFLSHSTFTHGLLLPSSPQDLNLRTCEPIRSKLCQDVGYNQTGMPNFAGHELQNDAEFVLQTFMPLVQYGCSAQLHFFLCSVYMPMCTEKVATPIGPCRGLCESVRDRCVPVLQNFGFLWPPTLNCSKFPMENNREHMCMKGPGESSSPVVPLAPVRVRTHCSQMAKSTAYVHFNQTGRCIPLCERDILFSSSEKRLTEVWVFVSAGLCFITSALALISLIFDTSSSRFKYPERPLAFLALCYCLASLGWGARAAFGARGTSCIADSVVRGRMLLAPDGLRNARCALVFFLLYYFGNAAGVWWLVLTVAWFLAGARSWSHENLLQLSALFHLAGWGIPAVLTITALLLHAVDADELTGACGVGHQSAQHLLALVLTPQFILLVLGASLLSCGLLSLARRRRGLPEKIEAVTMRLGVFGVLYTTPAACVVASLFYEYHSKEEWLAGAERPSIWIFLLRVFMSQVVGITAALWLWSPRVFKAWTSPCRQGYYKAPTKCQPIQYFHEARKSVQRVQPNNNNNNSHVNYHYAHSHSHRKSSRGLRMGQENITTV